jgi:hypothetical protein
MAVFSFITVQPAKSRKPQSLRRKVVAKTAEVVAIGLTDEKESLLAGIEY